MKKEQKSKFCYQSPKLTVTKFETSVLSNSPIIPLLNLIPNYMEDKTWEDWEGGLE